MSTETNNQKAEPHRRVRRHRSAFKKWLDRIRTSRTAQKKFHNQLLLFVIVLAAFAFGLFFIYAIEPIANYSPRK